MIKINSDLIRQTKQMMQSLKLGNNVATAATDATEANDASGTSGAQASGINLEGLSKPVKQAVTLLKENGYAIDREALTVIQNFMENGEGTTGQKLKALEVLVSKDMPVEGQLLQDLHTGRTATLVDFLRPNNQRDWRHLKSDKGEDSESHFKANGLEGQLASEAVIKGLEMLMDSLMSILSTDVGDKSVDNGDNSVKNPSDAVSKVLKNIPDIVKSDEKTHASFDENGNDSNPVKMKGSQEPAESAASDEPADIEANKTLTLISEQNAFENLIGALETPEVLAVLIDALESQFGEIMPVAVPSADPFTSKSEQHLRMVIEERVTPKLQAVRHEFDTQKKTILSNLNRLQPGGEIIPHAEKVQVLAKITDQLDHMIMKSDVGLYLGIKEEKTLLKQSTLVDQARVALTKGDLAKAEKLIKSVVEVIEELEFKPTLQKAMALPRFGTGSLNSGADMAFDQLKSDFGGAASQFSKSEKSVGGLIQYLRRMGMNHETEVFQQTFAKQSGQQSEKAPINLKEQLLQLSRSGLSDANQSQADGALSHISGQQLNNKLLDKSQPQQMLLSIPLQQQGQVAEMKVYIQTKQEKLKADWKNFDMFFVLSTSQVGEIGVKVRSVDLKLSVDVLNNHVNREALFKPLVDLLTKDIEEVGFVVTRVGFKAWDKESPTEKNETLQPAIPKTIISKDGGFDVKI